MVSCAPSGAWARMGLLVSGLARMFSTPQETSTRPARGRSGVFIEWNIEEFRQRQHQIAGDGVQIVDNPVGVGHVVVEGQLQQHGWGPHPADLADGGGGLGPHQVGQGIDGLQPVGNQLGRLPALGASGVVEGDRALGLAVLPLRRGVGVKGQVQVEIAGVGGRDGGGGRHIRGVADIPDAGGVQIGDHLVGQKVHIRFLSAPGDVIVILLRGGGEIDNRHSNTSSFLHPMKNFKKGATGREIFRLYRQKAQIQMRIGGWK